MFNIDWEEMAVIAFVAMIVLGPKELPGVMRTAGQMVRKARSIAHEFRLSLDEMVEEAELKEIQDKAYKQAVAIEPAVTTPAPAAEPSIARPTDLSPPETKAGGQDAV